jgi:hypothetical protein
MPPAVLAHRPPPQTTHPWDLAPPAGGAVSG